MTPLRKILLSLALLFAFMPAAFAQESSTKKVFEFFLHDKIAESDAKKIDDFMVTRYGILESKTDVKTGKVTVKAIPAMDFAALRSVINYLGYEATEENMVIREE